MEIKEPTAKRRYELALFSLLPSDVYAIIAQFGGSGTWAVLSRLTKEWHAALSQSSAIREIEFRLWGNDYDGCINQDQPPMIQIISRLHLNVGIVPRCQEWAPMFCRLQHLKITGTFTEHATLPPSLKSLQLDNIAITGETRLVLSLGDYPVLECLRIKTSWADNNGRVLIEGSPKSVIKELAYSGTHVHMVIGAFDDTGTLLPGTSHYPELETLEIGQRDSDEEIELDECWVVLPAIRKLTMECCSISDGGKATATHLEELEMHMSTCNSTNDRLTLTSKRYPSLRRVILHELDEGTFVDVIGGPESKLERFNCNGASVVAFFGAFPKMTDLCLYHRGTVTCSDNTVMPALERLTFNVWDAHNWIGDMSRVCGPAKIDVSLAVSGPAIADSLSLAGFARNLQSLCIHGTGWDHAENIRSIFESKDGSHISMFPQRLELLNCDPALIPYEVRQRVEEICTWTTLKDFKADTTTAAKHFEQAYHTMIVTKCSAQEVYALSMQKGQAIRVTPRLVYYQTYLLLPPE